MAVELVPPLRAAAWAFTRNAHDAEDAVQDALYRAYRRLDSFERGTNFRGWLFRILHNVCINRAQRFVVPPVDATDFDPEDNHHPVPDIRAIGELPSVADRHFDDRVKAALDALPEVYRTPFVMFSLGAMKYEEIAEALHIPIGTVMSRLYRARIRLREALLDYAHERGHPVGEDGR